MYGIECLDPHRDVYDAQWIQKDRFTVHMMVPLCSVKLPQLEEDIQERSIRCSKVVI